MALPPRLRLAPVLAAALLAGCLTGEPEALPPAAVPGEAGDLVAVRGGLPVPVPAAFQGLATRLAPTGFQRGEPTVGITAGGVVFTVAGAGLATPALPAAPVPLPLPVPGPNNRFASVARSVDHGHTWERLWDPVHMGKIDFDPWVWVDPLTDRVFHAPLYVACSHLAWSDDLGATWASSPLGGCGTPAHDHQKLTSGPAPAGLSAAGGSVLYYSYNSFRGEGTVITTSLDGGLTWGREATVHAQDRCLGGIAGPVDVAPDGTAYSPKPTCDGVSVAVSLDGGRTWAAPVAIRGPGAAPHTFYNPHVAVDLAGNAYAVGIGADSRPWLSTSLDRGATWGPAVPVLPAGLRSAAFVSVVAGAPGHVAVGTIATTSDPAGWPDPDPSEAADDAVWHAYLTFGADALDPAPTFVTQRLTPPDDPVQVGCIWLRGGSEPCRNLRDFVDLQQHQGRAYFVYADGCDRCATAAESRRLGETTVAIVEAGPGLLGGLLEPLPGPAPGAGRR